MKASKMSLCLTNTEQLRAMQQGLLLLSTEGGKVLNGFEARYRELMASFEIKRKDLETELERASRALDICESWRGPDGEYHSCHAEKARYAKAQERLHNFMSLINEARFSISEYEAKSQVLRNNICLIEKSAVPYLCDLEQIMEEYLITFN